MNIVKQMLKQRRVRDIVKAKKNSLKNISVPFSFFGSLFFSSLLILSNTVKSNQHLTILISLNTNPISWNSIVVQ